MLKKLTLKSLTKFFMVILAITPVMLTNSASVFLWQEPEAPEVFND